jgi:hypothetical protein
VSLTEQLKDDMKAAMRAKDKARLGAMRMLSSALQNAALEQGGELDEGAELAVVQKLLKQRRDAAEQYREAGRDDLAEGEDAEAEVLEAYLPQALSDEEIDAAVDAAIEAVGAEGPQQMGQVMGRLKEQLQGRADLGQVSQKVKARLSGSS